MNKEITTTTDNNKKKGVDSAGDVEGVVGYTISKDPQSSNEIEPSDKNCYAKKTILKTGAGAERSKYYIKMASDGSIFDPWGMYSEGTQGLHDRERGRSKWSFSEVNESCFNFYIKFLQSRNNSWLMNAKREIR
tara:strand:- start:1462 stop:1863 length:402 start_codon:yes stop_codon:yes gene_type:complete